MNILSKQLIRKSEESAVSSGAFSFRQLMYTAGTKAGEIINDKFSCENKKIAVLCGKGNNGGDGFVYANEKPGLGVELNEQEAAKYPCENTVTTWTQTRNRDGSLQTP